MIVELAIGAAAVVVASAIARAVAVRRAEREAEAGRKRELAARAAEPRRGLRVGDVLLYVGDELWLAGALELDEEGTRIWLFRAPENARVGWVVQLDERGDELALALESAEIPEGPVPDRLPLGGRLLSLRRRGRAKVRARGEQVPKVGAGSAARFVVLEDAGGRMAVVVDLEGAGRVALVGDRVERALIDVLPGGD